MVIMGHRMSDLDAIGAAEGVLRICKICDVPAVIAVRRDATLAGSLINALVAAGQEDDFIDPKGALPIISQRTLCIIVDTYPVSYTHLDVYKRQDWLFFYYMPGYAGAAERFLWAEIGRAHV